MIVDAIQFIIVVLNKGLCGETENCSNLGVDFFFELTFLGVDFTEETNSSDSDSGSDSDSNPDASFAEWLENQK